MSVNITVTISEETPDAAWFQLARLAESVLNNQKDVDNTSNVKVASEPDSQSTPKPANEKAPAKSRVVTKKAAPEPAAEPEADAPAEDASVDRDAIVSQITSVYRDGDDDTKAKIVAWRNSCGVKLLRDLKPEHMPSAVKFLREIIQ